MTSLSKVYKERIEKRIDELKWLYMELYGNDEMLIELTENMERFYKERPADLRRIDIERETDANWYKSKDIIGMMLYIDNFAGNLQGVQKKLGYLEKAGINYVHLMPFLDTPKDRSDGGYAVRDFRKVRNDLGTMEDLRKLTLACHKKNMSVCMDFVMNHTSEDHKWAKKARKGDGEYMSRYFFYDNPDIPNRFDETVPQVFPTTAPGNFTYLPEINHFVMTSFYPYQWDLNYANPRVFNEMMYNFLFLANQGIDVMRLDAVPYIWKEIGTRCRNNPEVHTLVRMMRIISEIVCPGVVLLGEVVMEPDKVVPYFGTVEKPECHMLYNVTTMATTWHTIATRDCKLLKRQLDILNALPKDYTFLNYLRCHDDIGWGLDYKELEKDSINEIAHKKYLNDYFRGYTGNSNSRGELYNDDPITQDARLCGTTASLCGIERAGFEKNEEMMAESIRKVIMLHAYMLMQTGIPVIYSGDEIGAVNDYSYKKSRDKADDSRFLHRGKMNWKNADKINDDSSVEARVFNAITLLEKIRKENRAYDSRADAWTMDTWDAGTLAMGRYFEGQKILGIFNFSEQTRTAWINEDDGDYVDLITGQVMLAKGVNVEPFGFYILKKEF